MTRILLASTLLICPISAQAVEVAPKPRLVVDLTGYRTPREAIRANPKEFSQKAGTTVAGRLGVAFEERKGRVVIDDVEVGSPAEIAGLRSGDVVRIVDQQTFATVDRLRDYLRGKLAGDTVRFDVERAGKRMEQSITLRAASRPMSLSATRVVLGVRLGPVKDGGMPLLDVTPGGPAARAGLKAGDLILRLNGTSLDAPTAFADLLFGKKPGERVELLVERNGERLELAATLAVEPEPRGPRGTRTGAVSWDDRLPSAWRKPSYRLAIIGIEYPDVKHNPKITDKDWEASLFSRKSYTSTNATGQPVFGSMNDYYDELSHGTFTIHGTFAGWVEVSKKRLDYSSGSGTSSREKSTLLTEAMDKLLAKKGKDALKDYDGVFFLFAGERVSTTRGSLYWPHRASVSHNGKRWPYFIVQEGGARMTDISVFCHEFGHMLGLPDLYARPENPGSEGVGVWCAMANQIGGGRPQHFSAWSKEQLGWVTPAILDPRVKQKIVLAPIENDPTQCVKVMVKADGSEYFLLENRRRTGWDAMLPAEGLLIWRVVNNRPILEESHGVEGPSGPRVLMSSVPFPTPANDSFTPYTTPTSRGQLGGGLPVWITNIRKLPDGRVTFHIGYEYQ